MRTKGREREALQQTLEDLGLRGNEARVLLAVVRLGVATSLDAAQHCGISRTNVYRVLEDLAARRLVERVPGDGPAAWASPGVEVVLDRLHLDQQERLRAEQADHVARLEAIRAQHERRVGELQAANEARMQGLGARVADARDLLSEFAAEAQGPLPKVQLIPSAAQLDKAYDDLLDQVRSELLVLVRPPYAHSPGTVKQAVLDALGRGVRSRVLYEASQLAADDEGFRREIEAYHAAGVEARVVDELPIKLAVFDRAVALVALFEPTSDPGAYPSFLLVEHEGFAAFQAEAFEHRWATGRPYDVAAGGSGGQR